MQWPIIPIKNLTSIFPLIFLSKHISLYALGRFKWILDIIWPLNQQFNLKNQRNWLKQIWTLKFWDIINCIFVHWTKKLTLVSKTLQLLTVTFIHIRIWLMMRDFFSTSKNAFIWGQLCSDDDDNSQGFFS